MGIERELHSLSRCLDFSNPNQRDEVHWANEWRQYRWPTREHIIFDLSLSENLSPDHGVAIRADYCSFWLDFIPKLSAITGQSNERTVTVTSDPLFSPLSEHH